MSDKIASPVIQLIFQVEGIFDRDRSFWRLAFGTGDEKDPERSHFSSIFCQIQLDHIS